MTQEQKRKADAIETSIQLIGYSSRFLRERLNCHEPILDGFELEVIGNIHDNPELLKGGEQ